MRTDPALRFWLNYVASADGLWERADDSFLVVLPSPLQADFGLPDEARFTSDPDIAREDGIALLAAGHPALIKAAESVLDAGDVGHLVLAAPRSRPPDSATLLTHARERIRVDHGRIDPASDAVPATRLVLRVGAMVRYAVSAEDQLQEQIECCVDVPTRALLPEASGRRLLQAEQAEQAEPVTTNEPDGGASGETVVPPEPGDGTVEGAFQVAGATIEARAVSRRTELAADLRQAHDAERQRAEEYYAAAVASLEGRQVGATSDRKALLDARVASTCEERSRRLADIAERYQPRHEIQPYRLHLIEIPVLRLVANVRRGERRYPVVLDWLLPVGEFAPLVCPRCREGALLVATKTHLGCAECVPVAAAPAARAPGRRLRLAGRLIEGEQVSAGASPESTPLLSDAQNSTQPPLPLASPAAASTASAAQADPNAKPTAKPTAEPKPVTAERTWRLPTLSVSDARRRQDHAIAFWQAAALGEVRKLARLCAADSPVHALVRLFGGAAPLLAAGLGSARPPDSVSATTLNYQVHGLWATTGQLSGRHVERDYLLRWADAGSARLVAEILPFANGFVMHDLSASRLRAAGGPALFTGLPSPRIPTDQVSQTLLDTMAPMHGITLLARSLASWWRIGDDAREQLTQRYHPRVLAAALHRATCYWSNSDAGYGDVSQRYDSEEAAIRKATPALQRHLQLDRMRPW